MGTKHRPKRIAPRAYNALVEALAVVFWNLQPFEQFLRVALRDHPELLALTFKGRKRQVAVDLVSHEFLTRLLVDLALIV